MDYEYLHALREHFGYARFKKGQEEIIAAIMGGSDVLGIMPTGSGKSICYQIPAMLLPGITIVLSPLISLMKDQVDALVNQGIPATFINSTLSQYEVEKRVRLSAAGKYKLLYIAPERLESERFRDFLKSMPISLVAVDEAHCVSQWGHDFRPSYLSIAPFIHQLPERPVAAAFTATATDIVRQDIVRLLSLKEPKVFIGGYDRENLRFSVEKPRDKDDFILEYILNHHGQSGIVYAATRKQTEKLAELMSAKGIPACKYHAGMEDGERNKAQDAFARDVYGVMVATNAFGMGIDKSNVRFILHYNMPRDIESYYQEAGRAGRDGLPADCVLLYGAGDVAIQRFLINQSPDESERAKEYARLKEMVAYCHSYRCLRKQIREYFGETGVPEKCGNCGNCDITEMDDITIEAQKILSCVKRMGEGYGIQLTAAVLRGKGLKRVKELGFEKLSTYGIMKELYIPDIKDMIQYLISEGYLYMDGDKYPVLHTTQRALPVLRKEERVTWPARMATPVRKERPAEKTRGVKAQEAEADPALFEALKAFRTEAARRENVPPYVVFHDSTLHEICLRLPIDADSLLDVPGMGRHKLEKYGDAILRIVKEHNFAKLAERVMEAGKSKPRDGEKASHVITFEMFSSGKSIEAVAALRCIAVSSVRMHLLRCRLEGMDIAWESIIPAGVEELVMGKVRELGCGRLNTLKKALPEAIDYGTIQAVIAKNGLK